MEKRTSQPLSEKTKYLPDVHRLLPQSPDAEMGVLCSLLLAPREVFAMCCERRVMPEHFHIPAHGDVFRILIERADKGQSMEFGLVLQSLRDRQKLDSVGGPAFVSSLYTFLGTATNAAYYLDILAEKALLRGMIAVTTKYAARAYDEQGDAAPALLDAFEAAAMGIRSGRSSGISRETMKDRVMRAIGNIQALYERRGHCSGIETGFKVLDQMTDGLHAAEMIVVAARPSMGKTAIAMNIAEHIALNLKKPVGFFSLEMTEDQLTQRMLCSRAMVNLENIRNGFLSERDFPALASSASAIATASDKFELVYTPSISITELRARARRMKQEQGIEALFIDYLQLIRSTSKRAQDSRQLEVSEVSAGLKALAGELGIPVVVLAQLNRDVEKRSGGRPRLSDLRESGSTEQDADMVALLHREDYYAETEEEKERLKGRATLIIAKQRNGPTGDVPLTFLREYTRYQDRAEGAEPEV